MTFQNRLIRHWTRLTLPFQYSFEEVTRCWCGGPLGPSRSALVGECRECGTGVLLRRLTEESYARWYATSTYRRWVMGTDKVTAGQLAKEIRRAAAAYKFLDQHWHGPRGHSVLDIGCGAGGAIVVAQIAGASEVLGVDSDPRSRVIPASFGVPVMRDFPVVARWDIVLCSHLIEHVLQPVEFLRMLGGYLAPLGCLYVETPAWGPKAEVKLPHPYMYTPESFRLLAKRAGVEIVAMTDGIQAILRRV